VTFHLKTDPRGVLQYGLIAEEVNEVYPDLVIRDDSGSIQGIRYDELAPLLLNQVQQQQRSLAVQAERLTSQERRLNAQGQELSKLQQQLTAMLKINGATGAALQGRRSSDGLIAHR
jgi:hypothetical protein